MWTTITIAKYGKPYTFADKVEDRPVMLKGLNFNKPSDTNERVCVITLGGLNIKEPYLAVSTKKKTGEPDFANLLLQAGGDVYAKG